MKTLFVCSSGGHLDQLLALQPMPSGVEAVWATFLKPDSQEKLDGERVYGLHWPTNRNLRNLIRNTVVAVKVLHRERPGRIVSSGAAAAVPFFVVGKYFFRTENVYLECFDRISLPTLTARIVRPFTSRFICQWPSQLTGWPRRTEYGPSR